MYMDINTSTQSTGQDGFSPEELQAFGFHAEPTEKTPTEPENRGPSPEELQALVLQTQQEQLRQGNLLQQQLEQVRSAVAASADKPHDTRVHAPGKIPVKVDDQNRMYLDPVDIAGVAKGVVDEYHQAVINPLAPVVESVATQREIQNTVDWLRKIDPKLVEGKDAKHVAGLAIALYESKVNPGQTNQERAQYVIDQLRTMALAPGNPIVNSVSPSNHVGRTDDGREPNLPYPKGAKIIINRTSISEMGLDGFQESISREAYLRELNDRYKLGWTFDVRRPD
jgi:hypothetical protein